ncbi:hypothetical protein MBLNU13_g10069t1 [Cladosporium sp. NU13]
MATKQSTAFTARDTELLSIAFQCIKEKPVIDYELMAAKTGLKGAKSARDSFNQLYNKILSGQKTSAAARGEDKEQSGEPSPKKKATPSKRKAVEGGKEDDDEETSFPTKKKKATPGKAKGKKKPVADADDEDGAMAVKSEVVEQAGDDN